MSPLLPTPLLSLRIALLALLVPFHGAHALEPPPLLGTFDPDNLGSLTAIAFDDVEGEVYAVDQFMSVIGRYSTSGTSLGTIPLPDFNSNEIDIDFASTSFSCMGTLVPANALLVFDDNDLEKEFWALNKTDGSILCATTYPNAPGRIVGAAYHENRDSLFTISFSTDEIAELDPATGTLIGTPFDVSPTPPGTFLLSFGDVEVSATGQVFIVGSFQPRIRELTAFGEFVRDIDVSVPGIASMSGLALDDSTGNMWITSTTGDIYLVSIPAPGAAATLLASCNPAELAAATAIAFDSSSGNIFAVDTSAGVVNEFTPAPACAFQGSIPLPDGASNSIDIDFAPEAFDLVGTNVPAGSLLVFDDQATGPRFCAIDPSDGSVVACDELGNVTGGIVGASFSTTRDSLYAVSFNASTVWEVDPSTGSLPQSPFIVNPPATFDVSFGDVEVNQPGGALLAVGSTQPVIRFFLPDGGLLGDIGLDHLGIGAFSGIAIDDATQEIWLSSTDGNIHHLPEPAPAVGLVWGALMTALLPILRRSRGS